MFFGESAFYGNIWIAQFEMPKIGMEIEQHQHEHDHVSLLCKGSVSVSTDGGPENVYNSPTIILIRKNIEHKIKSLSEDTLWYCIFALRDIDGSVIDQFDEENLPRINPMLMGTQTSLSYKILYEELLEENKKIKSKYIDASTERDFLKKRIIEQIPNANISIPINNNLPMGGIVHYRNE